MRSDGGQCGVFSDRDNGYNIYRLFVLKALDVSRHKHQVQTLRRRLFQTAGKVVDHANRMYLNVRRGLYALFDEIRLRIREFARTYKLFKTYRSMRMERRGASEDWVLLLI